MLAAAVIVPVIWVLKSFAYWGAFRIRTIRVSALSCLIIAGAPFFLSILPLPGLLSLPATIALAAYLTMHYTGVELIPEGLGIPLGIEVTFLGMRWLFLESGLVF
jgi:hypothetical protein